MNPGVRPGPWFRRKLRGIDQEIKLVRKNNKKMLWNNRYI